MSDKRLSEITPEDIESARLKIEDTLIWMRDESVFFVRPGTYVGNGLVIRSRDGEPSDVIRLRVNEAIEMAIKHILENDE